MIRTLTIATLLTSTVFAGCAGQDAPTTPGTDELAGETGQDGEAAKADAAHDNFGFMAVEKSGAFDCHELLSCTRYELSRPNRTTIKCNDGQYASQCGVHAINWDKAGLTQTQITKVEAAIQREAQDPSIGVQVLVKGTYEIHVDFLAFQATEVWLAQRQGGNDAGTFVRIFDNGIRCIKAPCPEFEEGRLNSSRQLATEGFDFGAGISDALQARTYDATSKPDGVIVVGDRTMRNEVSFSETLRTVNQVYLPVK